MRIKGFRRRGDQNQCCNEVGSIESQVSIKLKRGAPGFGRREDQNQGCNEVGSIESHVSIKLKRGAPGFS
jgi:hypothetical protein